MNNLDVGAAEAEPQHVPSSLHLLWVDLLQISPVHNDKVMH
jgi:hypothetical protein